MFDQSSVMLRSPIPPRPAPRKLTVWFLLANQQSGARDATNGKIHSGRNCQAKHPNRTSQKTCKGYFSFLSEPQRGRSDLHSLFLRGFVAFRGALHASVQRDLLQGERENEFRIIDQNLSDYECVSSAWDTEGSGRTHRRKRKSEQRSALSHIQHGEINSNDHNIPIQKTKQLLDS